MPGACLRLVKLLSPESGSECKATEPDRDQGPGAQERCSQASTRTLEDRS